HVAVLGIVKSGAAYIPLDREMPIERVEAVLTEVNASACFALESIPISCPILPVALFNADKVSNPMSVIEASPNDRAYVLYTSGSTGKPKGIPISHKQICHLIR